MDVLYPKTTQLSIVQIPVYRAVKLMRHCETSPQTGCGNPVSP